MLEVMRILGLHIHDIKNHIYDPKNIFYKTYLYNMDNTNLKLLNVGIISGTTFLISNMILKNKMYSSGIAGIMGIYYYTDIDNIGYIYVTEEKKGFVKPMIDTNPDNKPKDTSYLNKPVDEKEFYKGALFPEVPPGYTPSFSDIMEGIFDPSTWF